MTMFTKAGERVEMFVPLTKFDMRTGEFEAFSTVEEVDSHGEICDVEKSWPALLADAESQLEISGGKSVGVLRRQHNRETSIGKLTLMERSERNGIPAVRIAGICTDEKSKEDAATGVLTGVSIRGLAQRWPEPDKPGVMRYAWTLREEDSLVDKPAVPHALVEVMKSDGTVWIVKARGYDPPQGFLCRANGFHVAKDEARTCEAEHEEAAKAALPQRVGAAKAGEKTVSATSRAHAKSLIANDKVDVSDEWSFTTADGDVLLGDPADWERYGSWFLARVVGENAETRAAYAYPFGKDGVVYRRALVAAESRATQQGDDAIAAVAKKLLESIDAREEKKSMKKTVEVQKSLYNVSSLVSLLATLLCITSDAEWDETWEAIDAARAGKPDDGSGAKIVAQLKELAQATFDAVEAMLADERKEIDDELTEEMAMSLTMRALASSATAKQLIKSLRGHLGTGSNETPTEKEKAMKKIEEETVAELRKSLGELSTAVTTLSDRVGKIETIDLQKSLGGFGEQLAAIAKRFEEQPKSDARISQIEESLKSFGEAIEAVATALPVQRKGQLRAVEKAEETKPGESAKAEAKEVDPWADPAQSVRIA